MMVRIAKAWSDEHLIYSTDEGCSDDSPLEVPAHLWKMYRSAEKCLSAAQEAIDDYLREIYDAEEVWPAKKCSGCLRDRYFYSKKVPRAQIGAIREDWDNWADAEGRKEPIPRPSRRCWKCPHCGMYLEVYLGEADQ